MHFINREVMIILRENPLCTHENSSNPFHTPEFYSVPSVPLNFRFDPLHAPPIRFPFDM